MNRSHLRLSQVLIAAALVLSPITAQSAQSGTLYEVADPDGWVNVRDRDSREVVAQMDNRSRFCSMETTRDGMAVISVPHDGFVVSTKKLKVISTMCNGDGYTVVDRDGQVNLRRSPNGTVVGTVDSGSNVIVTKESGEWWRVLTSDGRTGFIHSSRLR
jgi:hypothetical protein